jgi:hypothetical protein
MLPPLPEDQYAALRENISVNCVLPQAEAWPSS